MSLLSCQPEEEFLVNPVKEPEFHTIDSEESIAFQGPTLSWTDMAHLERTGETEEKLVTFEFPIKETGGATKMKKIPPSALPNFCGTSSEDPNAFLFEFDVLCRSYDYYSNAQKLNFIHATLKDATLRWFMGLGSNSIATWGEMKKVFLRKYQDYCKIKDLREQIFGMTQKEGRALNIWQKDSNTICRDLI